MNTLKDIIVEFRVRLLVGAGCIAVGFAMAVDSGEGLGQIAGLLAIVAFAIVGGIVLAPAISAFFSFPLSSLFYPTGKFSRPQPMYSVPQARRAAGLYEEAIKGYEQIAAKYPGESLPYIEMINIAVMDLHDMERARTILNCGLALLEDEATRKFLRQHYDSVITRLELKPGWLQEQESRNIVTRKIDETVPVDEPDGLGGRRFHPGGYNQTGKDGFVDERRKVERKQSGNKG